MGESSVHRDGAWSPAQTQALSYIHILRRENQGFSNLRFSLSLALGLRLDWGHPSGMGKQSALALLLPPAIRPDSERAVHFCLCPEGFASSAFCKQHLSSRTVLYFTFPAREKPGTTTPVALKCRSPRPLAGRGLCVMAATFLGADLAAPSFFLTLQGLPEFSAWGALLLL